MIYSSTQPKDSTANLDRFAVTIVEAKCLGAKSGNTEKVSPYCRLRSNFSNQQYKTQVIEKNSLAPKWNETFKFYPTDYPPTGAITVKFYEKNFLFRDGFLGEVVVDISKYVHEPEHDFWLYLHDEPKKKPPVRGEVHIHISYMPSAQGFVKTPEYFPRAVSQPFVGMSPASTPATSTTAPPVLSTAPASSSGSQREKKEEKFLNKDDIFNLSGSKEQPKGGSVKAKNDLKGTREHDVSILRVEDKYEIGAQIGKGSFGSVYKGKNNFTGEEVAIKVINKKNIKPKEVELLTREVKIMKKLRHPHIVRLHDLFDGPSKLYIVLELVPGGELFDQIVNKGSYEEQDAKLVVAQLLQGVEYMHKNGVVHRDLKPENLLCVDESHIKIADFGMSKDIENMGDLKTTVGTPSYIAPEVLVGGPYDSECDMWSIGVLSYVLLCGFTPFHGETQKQLFDRILNAQLEFFSPEWDEVSKEAKDFVSSLLQRDPSRRPSATQALQDKWFQEKKTCKLSNATRNISIMQSQRISERVIEPNLDDEDDIEPLPPTPGKGKIPD